MRKFLNGLYDLSGVLAALLILAICAVISTQVVFNIITRLRLFEANLTIPSYADISGYMLAGASFLALAYALMRGGHIRVTLFLTMLGPKSRRALDVFCVLLCGLISAAATYYMLKLTLESYEFGDTSPGILPIPIWTAQLPMTIGLAILTIAFADLLIRLIKDGTPLPEAQGIE